MGGEVSAVKATLEKGKIGMEIIKETKRDTPCCDLHVKR
jgi:hypothetical protein